MPHIFRTATCEVNITAISLCALRERNNFAAQMLRAAGIEPAEPWNCAAIKLVRNIMIMEKHGLEVPSSYTKPRRATTLTDLPTELLLQCRESVEMATRRDVMSGLSRVSPMSRPSSELRVLHDSRRPFGANRRLKAIALDDGGAYAEAEKKMLGRLPTFLISKECGQWMNGHLVTNQQDLVAALTSIDAVFTFNEEHFRRAVIRFLSKAFLILKFSPTSPFYLDSDGHNLQVVGSPTLPSHVGPLAANLCFMKKITLEIARIRTKPDILWQTDRSQSKEARQIMEDISRLQLVEQLFPQLKLLVVVVADDRHGGLPTNSTPLVVDVLAEAVKILRSLPVSHKFLAFSAKCWMPRRGWLDMAIDAQRELSDDQLAVETYNSGGPAVRIP